MQGLRTFCDYLIGISNDITKAQGEIEQKMQSVVITSGESDYSEEKKIMDDCKKVIEEVKNSHVTRGIE